MCYPARRPLRFAQGSLLNFFESTFLSEVPSGLLAYRWFIRCLLKHASWVSSTRRETLHPMPFHLPIRLGSKSSLPRVERNLLAREARLGLFSRNVPPWEKLMYSRRETGLVWRNVSVWERTALSSREVPRRLPR